MFLERYSEHPNLKEGVVTFNAYFKNTMGLETTNFERNLIKIIDKL